jgi:uncharacterized protein (TIGR02145 family)
MTRLLCMALILLSWRALGQAPQLIPYQAIARDAAGQPLANTAINARFTIHDASTTGAAVWQETQTVSTSALGLFTVQLGSNVSLGSVNWANGSKFMQVEIDLGSGFVDIGTQQMLSVPYALYSRSIKLNVSSQGDTLHVGDNNFVIVPGISEANDFGDIGTTGAALHTCGAPNVHNRELTYGTMTDQEGNAYKTILIGTQEWMAENLNTSIYSNGDTILWDLTVFDWQNTTSGAWIYWSNDTTYACPFGRYYNWFACVDIRGLCPIGWHVPSKYEWSTLINEFGGSELAGDALKSLNDLSNANNYWNSNSSNNTNLSGFSGLPGGFHYPYNNNFFYDFGDVGYWWSSNSFDFPYQAWSLRLFDNQPAVSISSDYNSRAAFNVRCLRD